MVDPEIAQGTDSLVDNKFSVAEYVSLRTEILKLIELQAHLISLTVISLGAILGTAVNTGSAGLAFVYPVLALILGISWLNHAFAISRCAKYLANEFEPRSGDSALGWEQYVRRNPLPFGSLGYWGVRSIFMGSSLAAGMVGWVLLEWEGSQIFLALVSSAITLLTFTMFLVWREPSPQGLLAE